MKNPGHSFRLVSIPKDEAYWIITEGMFLTVSSNHVVTVIDFPELFGMSLLEIQKIYNAESEELGTEGKARERIILSLVMKGFIRIRYYRKRSSWTINVHKLSKNKSNIIRDWAVQMLEYGYPGLDSVIIDMPDRRIEETLSGVSSDNAMKNIRNE